MTITGVEFHRLKRRLSVFELARQSGIPPKTIHKMENGLSLTMSARSYIEVSKALGVTVDELIQDYDESMLSDGDRPRCWQAVKPPVNTIANYRLAENLSLQQLGNMLGVTREGARRICMRDSVSDKHIARLAEATGMTTRKFVSYYGLAKEEKAA